MNTTIKNLLVYLVLFLVCVVSQTFAMHRRHHSNKYHHVRFYQRIQKKISKPVNYFTTVFAQHLKTTMKKHQRGVASWYGPRFHRRRTASGESYNMYAMTAASKTLPLMSYAKVTNLRNGKTITVKINDRGPYVGNRILDLSYAAAQELGMVQQGTAMVDIEITQS